MVTALGSVSPCVRLAGGGLMDTPQATRATTVAIRKRIRTNFVIRVQVPRSCPLDASSSRRGAAGSDPQPAWRFAPAGFSLNLSLRQRIVLDMATTQVTCRCGALYERTEFMTRPDDRTAFNCSVCGELMETFKGERSPTYRLISGPFRMPKTPPD
jgi:hypothetical protein